MSAAEQKLADPMTIEDVAELLQITKADVMRLVGARSLPCNPESLRFDHDAIMRWLSLQPRVRIRHVVGVTDAPTWPPAPDVTPIEPPETGGVYAIGCTTGHVKIGKSWNLRRRFHGLQAGNPLPLLMLAVLSEDESDEREFHSMYAEHRIHGEWFLPHEELVAAIRDARRIW